MTPVRLYSFAIAFVLLIAAASPATAQTSRFYLAGYMGLIKPESMAFTESNVTTGNFEYEGNYAFAGALGLRLSKQLRVEGELSYYKNDADQIVITGGGSFPAGGELKTWQGLMNVYYDFDFGWKVQPYVGGGVGLAWRQGEIFDTSGLASNASADSLSFAWQVGAGAKYRVKPDLAFTGGYRYVDGSDLDLGSYEIDYGAHEFRIGLEYDLP